ncbi:MAG TPA: potassium-transporting ATPase subunit KdpC [Solirubrobacteraceae bacterium]|nr:potassium-transporting ATPase subunit KdpC [Solirubrobacteraceae bacterium]
MLRELRSALVAVLVLTVLLGLAYPLAITGVAQLLWSGEANGSRVLEHGRTVGSSLIGQDFAADSAYFQSRPSVSAYDPAETAASNLGPNSALLASEIRTRAAQFLRRERPYDRGLTLAAIPADAVTASGSGVDPDISLANARIQAHRVAALRHLRLAAVLRLVAGSTHSSAGGLFGPEAVNVLNLNMALDALRSR